MMSNDIFDILSSPTKEEENARGILAKLFRQILADTATSGTKFHHLMTNYLNNPFNGFSHDRKRKSSERSNLMKELARPNMTFKVFVKGIQFLAPVEAVFEVKLKWRDNRTTIHSIPLRVMDLKDSELDDVLGTEEKGSTFHIKSIRK